MCSGELDDEILGLEVDLHRLGIELATPLAGLDGLSDLRLDLGDPFIAFTRIGWLVTTTLSFERLAFSGSSLVSGEARASRFMMA